MDKMKMKMNGKMNGKMNDKMDGETVGDMMVCYDENEKMTNGTSNLPPRSLSTSHQETWRELLTR